MHKQAKLIMAALIMLLLTTAGMSITVCAEEGDKFYINDDTGYVCFVEDDADRLTEDEELMLVDCMIPITEYGHAAYISSTDAVGDTDTLARELYRYAFGTEGGIIFVDDTYNRNIFIFSDGEIYKTVTSSYAELITDNVYTYASDGEYYACAEEAFYEIEQLLSGNRIAMPMKYIGNVFIALGLSAVIMFIAVLQFAKNKKSGDQEMLAAMDYAINFHNEQAKFVKTTSEYSPPSSSSSSGGGGGGSSGGGGGHGY